MFAALSSPQRVQYIICTSTQIVPRNARQGIAPAHNTFHSFKALHTFKHQKHVIPNFLKSSRSGHFAMRLLSVSLPGKLDVGLSSAD